MTNYTNYMRGSEWRKWDLHIHTPETKKNDQFLGNTPTEQWENYVNTINSSLEEIAVIGITDYFSIDNYFKFKSFVASRKITKKFDLILPNVELRILPATGSAIAINIHCVFNPNIDNDIEQRFLGKLTFKHGTTHYSASRSELIRFGKDLKSDMSLGENQAIKAGIDQFVISLDTLRTIFDNDPDLRDNTIIVVSNKSNDGASGLTKHADFFNDTGSQLDSVRRSIYQLCDAIFSSNEGDRNYFIGKGADIKETVIKKCHVLMPCFHGCDAHDNNTVFKPANNRYCWVKADPTFEGLKQTLYEPEDRVRVQAMKPEFKNERHVISDLNFIDNGALFGNQKILLNENLNAIIGGKSSGKSLLMYFAAKSIDPEQVRRAEDRLKFEGYKFDENYDFEVIWKNGDKDRLSDKDNKVRGITYIPQLYINHLVERNNKEELNKLIKNILLQDKEFKEFFEERLESIRSVTSDTDSLLTTFLQTRLKGLDLQQKIKEIGSSESIGKGIQKIQTDIDSGQKASNLNQTQFAEYNKLVSEKSEIEKDTLALVAKQTILDKFLTLIKANKETLFGKSVSDTLGHIKGQIDRVLDEFTDIPSDVMGITIKVEADYDQLIGNLEKEILALQIDPAKKVLEQSLFDVNGKLKPYLDKIAGQQELKKLTVQLEEEKQRQLKAENLEKQFKTVLTDYASVRVQITKSLVLRFNLYNSIVLEINTTKNNIGSEITLICSLIFPEDSMPLFEQANKASIGKENVFNTVFRNKEVQYNELLKLLDNSYKVADDKLIFTNDKFIPLKQKISLEEVLRGIVMDKFDLDYTVTYKNDNLLTMSPGKKGTVLLILFLQISSAQYPIFIDQPEDNLDNRTIYDLLCQMIKEKKKERQIIIVSHNANLVVATDAENIIVANQEGQGNINSANTYRFEYVNGSLEHSFEKNPAVPGVLLQQGIKQHACDILEGGGEAFKQRERKYSIK